MPIIITKLLYSIPYNFCLTSYYIVLYGWIFFVSKKVKVRTFRYEKFLYVFSAVVFGPSIICFIVEQAIDGDYVLFNNIYLLYFAGLVGILNGFYQYKGYKLYKKISDMEETTKIAKKIMSGKQSLFIL